MERRYDWVVKFKELEYKYYRLAQGVQPKPDEPTTGGNEMYIENVGDEAGTFSVKRNGNPVYTPNLEVKVDNSNWITYNIVEGGTVEVTVPKGSKIYLRGNNPSGFNGGNGNDDCFGFTFSQPYNIGGYINSLLTVEGFETYELSDTGISHTFCRLFAFEFNLKEAKDLVLSLEYLTNNCYSGLFGWSGITSLPQLPSTHLESYCYHNLCYECRDLQDASIVLPAEDVRFNSYDYMFANCSNLVNAPIIKAKKIDLYGCVGMFAYCTSLQTAPQLEFTEVFDNGCQAMFRGCTALQTPPQLLPTTALDCCYMEMFDGCTALVEAPELPATTLYQQCYRGMFRGCTALEVAPVLVAPVLEGYFCYAEMFQGCSNLRSVTLLCDDIVTEANLSDWLDGVPTTGTLTKKYGVEIPSGSSGIPEGWEVVDIAEPFYIENIDSVGRYFKVDYSTSLSYMPDMNLSYKIDDGEWKEYIRTIDGRQVYVPSGSKIYLKGDNPNGFNNSDERHYFNLTDSSGVDVKPCNVGGFITSLFSADGFTQLDTLPNYACYKLFSGLDIHSAKQLITANIKAVGDWCFAELFYNQTNLTDAPKLSATTLAQYCYNSMFYGCTSLVTAPELPGTTLAQNCYASMFRGCTSLVTATELPATTLAPKCYSFMFYGCTSLTTSPELPGTMLVDRCYSQMFDGCSKLESVTALFETYDQTACAFWLDGVSATGTFYKKAGLTIPSGASGIPEGWTVVEV